MRLSESYLGNTDNGNRFFTYACISLLLVALYFFGHGLYIHAKAGVAQILIADAWEKQQIHGGRQRPWAWADTWPIAKLNFPKLNKQRYVLAGGTEAIMAFGPAHLSQTAFPGQRGNSVISGHRDTHFSLLKDLEVGDLVEVTTQYGDRLFQVDTIRIAHQSQLELLQPSIGRQITLVTCYPFDAVHPGTEHRYVVTASSVS